MRGPASAPRRTRRPEPCPKARGLGTCRGLRRVQLHPCPAPARRSRGIRTHAGDRCCAVRVLSPGEQVTRRGPSAAASGCNALALCQRGTAHPSPDGGRSGAVGRRRHASGPGRVRRRVPVPAQGSDHPARKRPRRCVVGRSPYSQGTPARASCPGACRIRRCVNRRGRSASRPGADDDREARVARLHHPR
jgi:hypothetical protein